MILSREPVSPWRDFLHRAVVGLAVVGFVTLAQLTFYVSTPILAKVTGNNVYRQVMGLSALHSMETLSMDVDRQAATITGSFVKRRCDFVRGNYYTRDANGLLYPAAKFESLVLDADRNRVRPPSPQAQTFGPWRITSSIPDPTALVIYVTMRCPEGTFTQMLADTPWENLPASAPDHTAT